MTRARAPPSFQKRQREEVVEVGKKTNIKAPESASFGDSVFLKATKTRLFARKPALSDAFLPMLSILAHVGSLLEGERTKERSGTGQ